MNRIRANPARMTATILPPFFRGEGVSGKPFTMFHLECLLVHVRRVGSFPSGHTL